MTAADALAVGRAAQLAGAGRRTMEDTIDPAAGVLLERRPGDQVAAGDLLATVFARDAARRSAAVEELRRAFTVGEEPPASGPVVLARD